MEAGESLPPLLTTRNPPLKVITHYLFAQAQNSFDELKQAWETRKAELEASGNTNDEEGESGQRSEARGQERFSSLFDDIDDSSEEEGSVGKGDGTELDNDDAAAGVVV